MSRRIPALLVLLTSVIMAGESAPALYRQARKALEKGDYASAYLISSQAVAMDPANSEYWAFSQAVRSKAIPGMLVDLGPAGAAEALGADSDPITDADLREARTALPPPVLEGKPGRKSFNLRGDAKRLFEEVLGAFGLMVVFDTDYQATRQLQFRVEEMDWREAVRALESVTGSFVIAMNPKLGLVAKDTPQKRAEMEPVMTVVFPFPEPLSPQEVQEAARSVQSAFDMTKMGIDNTRRLVMFRDRVSRLKPALDVFRQLMLHRGQVVTEVELLSVSENSSLQYGITLQANYPITQIGDPMRLGGGKPVLGVSITGASLLASMTQGQTKSLVRAELRALDGQAAQLHVGDRYPILTAGYYGTVTTPGKVYTPPPTVNFEDLGIVLKVTPHLHGSDEVTLELEAEFKTLTGQVQNGIPVISNRKFAARVRLNFEETAVVAGLTQETLTQSWSGLPVLARAPALRSNDKSRDHTQMLLTLRPRLVNLPPVENVQRAVRVGSETRPLTPLD